MNLSNRKDIVFVILAGFFITNAIVAELIGGKLVEFFGLFTQSLGIILWPVVFVMTDLINEYYGKSGVRKLTFITIGLIIYTFFILTVGINLPATSFSPVNDTAFKTVFGQSQWIIVGSIIAFLCSQLVDVYFFWVFRKMTNGKMIWFRATASTVISQLFDTFIVQFIAFVLPGFWSFDEFIHNAAIGYVFKLMVAVALIPMIYILHNVISKYLHPKNEDAVITNSN
jgi:uncharacterized integral membrane protein (TIGR00697 family)